MSQIHNGPNGPKDYKTELKKGLIRGGIVAAILAVCVYLLFTYEDRSASSKKDQKYYKSLSAGDMTYFVTKYESDDSGATGKIITLQVTVKNDGKNATLIGRELLKLKDGEGRIFNASNKWERNVLTGQSLNPGMKVSGYISFEVPFDAKGLKLQAFSSIHSSTFPGEIRL
ncbi:protein of unknown function [Cohnella sp. OV330]|uniref:DUF4352 domain-containing protein n=1 Tax=Cohnella sp. OV330 TaxID=1855288 RepID=UPI0008EE9FA3|nr:DUF4352 domain-containing protein [Cohnella sp. OV330]SFA91314.1 protein of unknown function [Cohnella sp. OV330]